MELTLQEKNKLINLFQYLLDEEISKPLGEMNSEAVDNYIKLILLLQGKKFELSSEFIDEQVRKIFREEEKTASPEAVKTTKKHYKKNKIWLVAACVAILVALFSVISFSSERSVKDILVEFFGAYEFIPIGEEVIEDNYSYGKENEKKIYNSIPELVNTEKINLLYPSNTMDIIKHVSIAETNSQKHICIVYKNTDASVIITTNSEIPQEIIDVCNEKITLNGLEYYLCVMDDVNQAQAYFIHDNNYYIVASYCRDSLMNMLKNMEEIKYED